MTTIVLRCDADARSGTGHAMRCLALAQALTARGARALIVSRALPAPLAERARGFGVGVRRLTTDGIDEVRRVLEGIEDLAWLVADSYELDLGWERAVVAGTRVRLAVIEDHASRAHACELLIDHNLSAQGGQYDGRLPVSAIRLLGPHYALLGPAFARRSAADARPRTAFERLHVAFGGADPTGETEKVLRALAMTPLGGVSVDVVVGGANPRLAAIRAQAAELPGVEVHADVEDMAVLLRRADLAVGAAGVSALERCACGLPALQVVAAANQAPVADALAERGAAVTLGAAGTVQPVQIARMLAAIAANPDWLRRMSACAAEQCDGHGAARVARRLLVGKLRLRLATPADAGPMLEWRNHERTRRYSRSRAPIDSATHARWFQGRLADSHGALLIAEDERGPVGVLRYDVVGAAATVSIYLAPERHGEGLGSSLLQAGHAWLREHRPHVEVIDAAVLSQHAASRRAFEEAGYGLRGLRLSRAP